MDSAEKTTSAVSKEMMSNKVDNEFKRVRERQVGRGGRNEDEIRNQLQIWAREEVDSCPLIS